MHHLIYTSRATAPMTEDALATLLESARRHNEQQGITGVLVYSTGQFLQLLEGDEAALATLYEMLLRDARHTTLIKLADKPIAQRSFTGWAMAFRTTNPVQFAALVGYTPLEQVALVPPSLSATDAHLLDLLLAMVTAPLP